MKLIKLIGILVLALSMMHCSKSEEEVSLQYNQTQCADPWSTNGGSTDEEVIASIKTYFETEYQINLENISISFDNNITEVCLACVCLSGSVITVTAAEQFSDDLEAEGFFIP
ncbi:MAG: hypothetical protein ACI8YQ_001103 [Polaribacter sp.]|jgi:hypothetical protein